MPLESNAVWGLRSRNKKERRICFALLFKNPLFLHLLLHFPLSLSLSLLSFSRFYLFTLEKQTEKKKSMEFFLELFLTVFFSLALAFFFAKLLPKASGAEEVEQEQKQEETTLLSRRRRSEEKTIDGFDGGVGMEETSFGGDELKNRELEIEKRVVEVGGETMVVDKYEGELGVEVSEMGHGEVELLKKGFELEQLVEVSAIESKDDVEVEKEVKIVQVEENPCEEEEKEVKAAIASPEDVELEEKLILGSSEEVGACGEIGLELAQEEQIIAQDEHVGVIDKCIEEEDQEIEVEKTEAECEEKESLFSDDDDWEGIERSEMEKIFGAASTFVGSSENNGCLSKLGSDVQMQLYGLNKVANEGPCHEPQPLAIMVSSRAKWHAWQRLGNMSPEVAMEAYIALLSDNVPGWMGKNPDGGNEQNKGTDSPEAKVSITEDHNLSSSLNQQLISENERKQGLQSCDEGSDAMGGPEKQ